MAYATEKDRDAEQERAQRQDQQYAAKLNELEAMYRKEAQRSTHPATPKQQPNAL